ncbi:dihydroorotate dehydrogenase [Sporanaerobium hydrogeniformans]|uniref:Dihydroorotate dehydrogenase n=1 Tax=Sporanaerobium hydrogeniformans TaxID=3072179 RepID=A0AC61DA59_9FIRM|nr:undecaprenyl diphosphate synthase family protein [Sporanaerobium hydrogeniformans]PHV69897.1 dihydroorotate dehydrogenase [Sporanaerobium hydrogeniformans]
MRIPRHIALIPDGNRRWAYESGLEKHKGYEHGLHPGVEALLLAQSHGVEELTYYGFTTDNCKRPSIQVKAFIKACVEAVELIKSHNVSLLVVGNTQSPLFPTELLLYTKERVSFGTGLTKVNFLVNYGWEWDLSHMDTCSNNRFAISDCLYSKAISRIDLVIRWGGRSRLSGLLPIQSVYADIYTLTEMWPEFTAEQFERALKWYNTQDVTLGG